MGWFDEVTPNLVSATWLEEYRIRLEFDDGCVGVLDMAGELWGPVFEPLENLDLFRRFRLDREWNTVSWPTGADLAPEYLYRQAVANPLEERRHADRSPREQGLTPAGDEELEAAAGGFAAGRTKPEGGA